MNQFATANNSAKIVEAWEPEDIRAALDTVKKKARTLANVSHETIDLILRKIAADIPSWTPEILVENQKDLARMSPNDPKYDRLELSESRLQGIANDLLKIAELPSPIDVVLESKTVPSGLAMRKVTTPLGVIGIVYEARPNVTFDVFALTFKSRNAVVLKGGSDAHFSNRIIVKRIQSVLHKHDLADAILLLPSDREALSEILTATSHVDVIIPRGSQGLIDYVRSHAKVPVIETGAGIVHTYVDKTADLSMASAVIANAKTRRVSVCNALDTLLLHEDLKDDLPRLCRDLSAKEVEIYADKTSLQSLKDHYPDQLLHSATPEHFGREYLSLKLSIKVVRDLDEALVHIAKYSSGHSEAIISNDHEITSRFFKEVDAAAVYANASTAFTDGGEFGLGAEIGISTQKLHARGPMGLSALTSYKWLIEGTGHVRSNS
ncbi:MAG: glutamate-5-semialdehyde dehydrogenase [Saprospiraceae bacterium]|nr:glutamate-5-semialdehyde dehydrogenase [Saprospiraceae bacterium]